MGGYSRESVRALCPFYIKEAKLSITCEGLLYRSQDAVRFERPDDRIAIIELYCKSADWATCPRAKILVQKYQIVE